MDQIKLKTTKEIKSGNDYKDKVWIEVYDVFKLFNGYSHTDNYILLSSLLQRKENKFKEDYTKEVIEKAERGLNDLLILKKHLNNIKEAL